MTKYDCSDMEKCEYMIHMMKSGFLRRRRENGKCEGFKNKYKPEKISKICAKCPHFNGGIKGDF